MRYRMVFLCGCLTFCNCLALAALVFFVLLSGAGDRGLDEIRSGQLTMLPGIVCTGVFILFLWCRPARVPIILRMVLAGGCILASVPIFLELRAGDVGDLLPVVLSVSSILIFDGIVVLGGVWRANRLK